jgi:hypothetical protein
LKGGKRYNIELSFEQQSNNKDGMQKQIKNGSDKEDAIMKAIMIAISEIDSSTIGQYKRVNLEPLAANAEHIQATIPPTD